MKSALEGLTKGHRKTKQAAQTAVIDVSALPPVMPLPKPKPSSKSMRCSASMTTRRTLLPTVLLTPAMLLSTMPLPVLQKLPAMLLPVLSISGLANQKQLGKLASRLRQSGCLLPLCKLLEAKEQAGLYSLCRGESCPKTKQALVQHKLYVFRKLCKAATHGRVHFCFTARCSTDFLSPSTALLCAQHLGTEVLFAFARLRD